MFESNTLRSVDVLGLLFDDDGIAAAVVVVPFVALVVFVLWASPVFDGLATAAGKGIVGAGGGATIGMAREPLGGRATC